MLGSGTPILLIEELQTDGLHELRLLQAKWTSGLTRQPPSPQPVRGRTTVAKNKPTEELDAPFRVKLDHTLDPPLIVYVVDKLGNLLHDRICVILEMISASKDILQLCIHVQV